MQNMATGYLITHIIARTAKATVYAASSSRFGKVALKHLRVVPDEDETRFTTQLQAMLLLHSGKLQTTRGDLMYVVPVLDVVEDKVRAFATAHGDNQQSTQKGIATRHDICGCCLLLASL